jgi:hypothetical protein
MCTISFMKICKLIYQHTCIKSVAFCKWSTMFCTRRSRSSGFRVFFQKVDGWLKLSSSPVLYLQSTTWWNEFLPFSCNAYQHYYHTDNHYVNCVVHKAVLCILTLHSCVSTYKTIQCLKHKKAAVWRSWVGPRSRGWFCEETSAFPCQEISHNSSTIQPTA